MPYKVLKDFKGSNYGWDVVEFKAGEEGVELSDELAEIALKEKWVKRIDVKSQKQIDADRKEAERLAAEKAAAEQAEAERLAAEKQQQTEAIQAEITQLEQQLAAAAEADKPAIQATLDEQRAALAAL